MGILDKLFDIGKSTTEKQSTREYTNGKEDSKSHKGKHDVLEKGDSHKKEPGLGTQPIERGATGSKK